CGHRTYRATVSTQPRSMLFQRALNARAIKQPSEKDKDRFHSASTGDEVWLCAVSNSSSTKPVLHPLRSSDQDEQLPTHAQQRRGERRIIIESIITFEA